MVVQVQTSLYTVFSSQYVLVLPQCMPETPHRGGILVSCLNHLNWLLLMWKSIVSPLRPSLFKGRFHHYEELHFI